MATKKIAPRAKRGKGKPHRQVRLTDAEVAAFEAECVAAGTADARAKWLSIPEPRRLSIARAFIEPKLSELKARRERNEQEREFLKLEAGIAWLKAERAAISAFKGDVLRKPRDTEPRAECLERILSELEGADAWEGELLECAKGARALLKAIDALKARRRQAVAYVAAKKLGSEWPKDGYPSLPSLVALAGIGPLLGTDTVFDAVDAAELVRKEHGHEKGAREVVAPLAGFSPSTLERAGRREGEAMRAYLEWSALQPKAGRPGLAGLLHAVDAESGARLYSGRVENQPGSRSDGDDEAP